jgi:hypothetical protein
MFFNYKESYVTFLTDEKFNNTLNSICHTHTFSLQRILYISERTAIFNHEHEVTHMLLLTSAMKVFLFQYSNLWIN